MNSLHRSTEVKEMEQNTKLPRLFRPIREEEGKTLALSKLPQLRFKDKDTTPPKPVPIKKNSRQMLPNLSRQELSCKLQHEFKQLQKNTTVETPKSQTEFTLFSFRSLKEYENLIQTQQIQEKRQSLKSNATNIQINRPLGQSVTQQALINRKTLKALPNQRSISQPGEVFKMKTSPYYVIPYGSEQPEVFTKNSRRSIDVSEIIGVRESMQTIVRSQQSLIGMKRSSQDTGMGTGMVKLNIKFEKDRHSNFKKTPQSLYLNSFI